MDPTELLIKIRDTFSTSPPNISSDLLPPIYKGQSIILTSNFKLEKEITEFPYLDSNAYEQLHKRRDSFYTNPDAEEIFKKTNPFENIGNSIFLNRAAIKLANIDAIYNFSDHQLCMMRYWE